MQQLLFQKNGWCGLGSIDCKPEDIEIFYGLSSDFWGQGLAIEAAGAMLKYGFDTIGLNRIVALVNPQNIASIKVIENLGIKYKMILDVANPEYNGYNGNIYYEITKCEHENNKK